MKTRVFRLKNYIATYSDGCEVESDIAYMFLGDGSDGCRVAITVAYNPQDPKYRDLMRDWSVQYIDSDDYFDVHDDFVEFKFKGSNPITKEIFDSIIYAEIESEGTINLPFEIPEDLKIGLEIFEFIDKISMKGIDDKDYTPLYTIGEED